MSDERWERLWELFAEASELPTDERAALLDRACGDDAALRRELDGLLAAHDESMHSGFLESGARLVSAAEDDTEGPSDPWIGRSIGPYTLTDVIGEGGMGIVYDARQDEPVRRRVALKLIRPGMTSSEALTRFESERQALAMMTHANIARVLDAGADDDGRPYFVMEHVAGVPITAYCDTHRLDVRSRVELFLPVCAALQHAHQKGIIHRDLKPSNVLVAVEDGKPVPKVIDFGVAKGTHAELSPDEPHTELGRIIGTPEYMSPEQAEMSELDIDTRTDVYALGVILYQLLCGALPFDSARLRRLDYGEIRRTIREDEPSLASERLRTHEAAEEIARARRGAPAEIVRKLRGDLDWITLRAMEKDRTRRYDTAAALGGDLERHLTDQPIEAGPPEVSYRVRKFVARHRMGVAAAAVLLASLLVALGGITLGLVRAERERERAAQTNAFLTQMLESVNPRVAQGRDTELLRDVLEQAGKRLEESPGDPLVAASLHMTLNETYSGLGFPVESERHARKAWELRRDALGEDHADTLEAAGIAGLRLWELGRYDEAIAVLEPVVEKARRAIGPEHPATLTMMNNLALATNSVGRFEESERLRRQVTETRREVLGADDPGTLISKSNLARFLQLRGELAEAEVMMREVVRDQRRVLGDDDPDTLISINILGSVLAERGELEQAELLHREALSGMGRTLGEDHSDTLAAQYNLARLLMEKGELVDARRMLEETLEVLEPTLGVAHPYSVYTSRQLARCVLLQGDRDEAEALYDRAGELAELAWAGGHPTPAAIRSDHGALLIEMERFEDAEPLLLASHAVQLAMLGADDAATRVTAERLAEVYEALGRGDLVERYREAASVAASAED